MGHEMSRLAHNLFCLKLKKMDKFHPFEVVGRASDTQLQVGENLNYVI